MTMNGAAARLPYEIPPEMRTAEGLARLVLEHPNIRFISLLAVDLGGNETDERIPAPQSTKEAAALLDGGVQTDGSRVALLGIATLNNAKVDLFADRAARWYVDYNEENIDEETGPPTGTVMIPAFLRHENRWVDPRSVLQRAEAYVGAHRGAVQRPPAHRPRAGHPAQPDRARAAHRRH
jgi:glutamine synthetase